MHAHFLRCAILLSGCHASFVLAGSPNQDCQPQTAPWECATISSMESESTPKSNVTLSIYPNGELGLSIHKNQQPWLDILAIKSSETLLFKGDTSAVQWYSQPCIGYYNWLLFMSAFHIRSTLEQAFGHTTPRWQKTGDTASAHYTVVNAYTTEVFRVTLKQTGVNEFAYSEEKIAQALQNPNILEPSPPEPVCPRPKLSDEDFERQLNSKHPPLACQKTWETLRADAAVQAELADLAPIGSIKQGYFSIAPVENLPNNMDLTAWHSNVARKPQQLGQLRALKPQHNTCRPTGLAW
ncbi:MAG: hypothetical protein ACRCV6_00210 [Formosimonas sp.]